MKLIVFACLIIMCAYVAAPNKKIPAKESYIQFMGTTPCNNIIRPLFNINPEGNCPFADCKCALVEWKLSLFQDPVTSEPTTYKLTGVNRFIVKETNMYSQPGTKSETEGKWKITRNSHLNPEKIIYQLNTDKPGAALNFVKLNDKLLHILDHEGKLMIGNEFWSYTLTRVAANE